MTGSGGEDSRPVRAGRVRWIALAGLLLSVASRAQELGTASRPDPADIVSVGLQALYVSGPGVGGGGSLEWYHAFSSSETLNMGVLTYSVGGSRWTYGRAGATWKPFSRTTLHAEADLGSGSDGGGNFGYRIYRSSLAGEILEKRLLLEIEDQYVDIRPVTGNIVKLVATFCPVASFSARIGVLSSTSGNIGARAVTARFDIERKRFTLFAGLSAGRFQPALSSGARQEFFERSEEFFGGAAIPVGQQQLTLALDLLVLRHGRRSSLVFGWKVPL